MKMAPAPLGVWFIALVSCGAYAFLGWWLTAVPPSISSDDARHFAAGLTRFSILDFSPHFPGYPAFIALGRLVREVVPDSVAALTLTSTIMAMLMPPAAALVAWRWTCSPLAAVFGFALGLTQPLLPYLALSGLSGSTGILFLLMFFALLPAEVNATQRRFGKGVWLFAAGISLGLSACARPSLGPILLASFGPLLFHRLRAAVVVGSGVLVVALPALLVIFALEGSNYIHEGVRFLEGHLYGWGNTAFSDRSGTSWVGSLNTFPALYVLLAVPSMVAVWRAFSPPLPLREQALGAAFLAGLVWTAFFQNPENLRHLAPILSLGGIVIAISAGRSGVGAGAAVVVLVIGGAIGVTNANVEARQIAPLSQAARVIDKAPGEPIVFTRRGVFYLREALSRARVYDLAFPATAMAALSPEPRLLFRLSRTPIKGCQPYRILLGRTFGEPSLHLYRTELSGADPECLAALRTT
ncbi:MAG: hypothetical protein AAGB11_15030 [Pseudomonadota bacterium]